MAEGRGFASWFPSIQKQQASTAQHMELLRSQLCSRSLASARPCRAQLPPAPPPHLWLFCSSVPLVRNLLGNSFPQHPAGQTSSKFHQCNFCHGELRLGSPNRVCFSAFGCSISALSVVDALNPGVFRVLFTSS